MRFEILNFVFFFFFFEIEKTKQNLGSIPALETVSPSAVHKKSEIDDDRSGAKTMSDVDASKVELDGDAAVAMDESAVVNLRGVDVDASGRGGSVPASVTTSDVITPSPAPAPVLRDDDVDADGHGADDGEADDGGDGVGRVVKRENKKSVPGKRYGKKTGKSKKSKSKSKSKSQSQSKSQSPRKKVGEQKPVKRRSRKIYQKGTRAITRGQKRRKEQEELKKRTKIPAKPAEESCESLSGEEDEDMEIMDDSFEPPAPKPRSKGKNKSKKRQTTQLIQITNNPTTSVNAKISCRFRTILKKEDFREYKDWNEKFPDLKLYELPESCIIRKLKNRDGSPADESFKFDFKRFGPRRMIFDEDAVSMLIEYSQCDDEEALSGKWALLETEFGV